MAPPTPLWDGTFVVVGKKNTMEERSMTKGILGLLLALCMLAALSPAGALADTVTYLDDKGAEQTCTTATVVTSDLATWTEGWYVVNGDVTITERIKVSDNVNLILANGCTLTAEKGISVNAYPKIDSLTIYAQSTGSSMGKLNVPSAPEDAAGIGGEYLQNSGTITINGGQITAQGGQSNGDGAGIGGGTLCGGTVVINGGIVDATGGNYAAGIGGGIGCEYPVNVTIRGGVVTATGGWGGGPGIGGGKNNSTITVEINGGVVTAIASDGNGWGASGIGYSNESTAILNFTTGPNGTAIIHTVATDICAGISDDAYKSNAATGGIIYEGNDGTVYGASTKNYTLPSDFTNEVNQTLTIPKGTTLTIPTDKTFTNYGTVYNYGTIIGTVNGNGKILVPATVVTAPVAQTGLIYDGNAQELVTAGTASGGTMQYRLGESGSYSTNIPKATDANIAYKVYYKVVADASHLDTDEQLLTVAIGKATPTVTAPQAISGLKFTGAAQELITAGRTTKGELQYSLTQTGEYSTAIPTGTNAKDYTVWYKVVGGDNYNDVAAQSVNASIATADSQLSGLTVKNGATETTTFTYGDTITVEFTPAVVTTFSLRSAPAVNEAALFLGATQLTDPASPDAGGKFTLSYDTTGKDLPIGTFTLTVKYGGSGNLNASSDTISVTLNAKGVTLSGVSAVSRAYAVNDTTVALDFTSAVVNGREGNDDVVPTGGTGTLATAEAANGKAVTVNDISFTGTANSYYLLMAQPTGLTVDITPKVVTNPTILLDSNQYYFTGKPIIPKSVVVKDGNNVIPQLEYTLSYANNIDVGENAQVIVTDNPDGNYVVGGSTVFTIVKAVIPPKTGDNSMPLLWLGLCLLGGAGLLVLTLSRKRRV